MWGDLPLLGLGYYVQSRGSEGGITLKLKIELRKDATDAVDAALNGRNYEWRRHEGEVGKGQRYAR
jgi:hypothetical protein